MQFTKTSKFLQLTDYALLEYSYNDTIINTKDCDFIRLLNAHSGNFSYINYNPLDFDKPKKLTGNVLDNTVAQVDESTWLHFDIDRPFKFYERYKELELLFQPIYRGRKTELNIIYDSIKVHIVSGYNFDDSSGMIIRGAYVDPNTLKQVFVCNYAYLKEDNNMQFNPKPFILGDRVYDKYIEVKIPSLQAIINTEYQIKDIFSTSVKVSDSEIYPDIYSSIPTYSSNCKINLLFYEIKDYRRNAEGTIEIKTPLPLGTNTNGIVRREIFYYDDFAQLTAVIQESMIGDYFEFFPTYNGEFLEDFILQQNSLGKNYLAIHDITMYEQLYNYGNYTEIMTHKQSFFQEEGFDDVFKYRPVVENESAITFTLEYTFRLLEKNENSQIIRKSTYTYPNAKKYGRWLNKINIPSGFQPLRIVNKIIQKDNKVFSSNIYNATKYISTTSGASNNSTTRTENIIKNIVPIQYRDISVNSNTLFVDATTNTDVPYIYTDTATNEPVKTNSFNLKSFLNSNIIYGQGEGVIYLSKMDNFVKFKLYKYDSKNTQALQLYNEIKSSETIDFYLVFYDKNNNEVKIAELNKLENLNTEKEEATLIFKIPSSVSRQILESTNYNFYITLENKLLTKISGADVWSESKDFETVLYTGKFYPIESYKKTNEIEYQTKESYLENKISEIGTKQLKMETLQEEYRDMVNKIETVQFNERQQELMNNFMQKWDTYMNEAQQMLNNIYLMATTNDA